MSIKNKDKHNLAKSLSVDLRAWFGHIHEKTYFLHNIPQLSTVIREQVLL